MAARYSSANCTIWEAARATTAAPLLFKRASISDGAVTEEFIGSITCSNSTFDAISEAVSAFGKRQSIGALLCIGSGKGSISALRESSDGLPENILSFFNAFVSETDRMHQLASARFGPLDIYFRLEVQQGMRPIPFHAVDRFGEVSTLAQSYLRDADVDIQMHQLMVSLLIDEGTVRLEDLRKPFIKFISTINLESRVRNTESIRTK